MASQGQQLHFLLIPFMSQSHIIPLSDFAKLLAQRGVTVSIITTPLNAVRCEETIDLAPKAGLRMIVLEFPGREAGLPPGCENMDSLPSMDLAEQFFVASAMMKAPLEKKIGEMNPKPSCLISTNALPWTQQVARKFNIPGYVFETISCFTLACSHKLLEAQTNQESGASDSETFVVPDIPDRIEFTRAQLPEALTKSSGRLQTMLDQIKEAGRSARGTLVNSFKELEPWYVEEYRKERQNIWCIGPVSLCNKNLAEKSYRGDKASIDERDFLTWLEAKEPRSVIYACFGSLRRTSPAQIKEIGLGLEASNFPFIWVIRALDCTDEVKKWLAEEKFEQRVDGRGLVVRGWAPQVLILSHPSVGGFVTHCGWNSTLEGVCAGVPMITWPMFAEQCYNEKFVVQVLKIGVSIGVEEPNKALVKWDRMKERIEGLMDEGKEGKERRRRAGKLGQMAKEALQERGSSYDNIDSLIRDVQQQRR